MTIAKPDLAAAFFILLIAWGLAVRLSPVLKYVPYIFLSGFLAAAVLSTFVVFTTTRELRGIRRRQVTRLKLAALLTDAKAGTTTLDSTKNISPVISSTVAEAVDGIVKLALASLVSAWHCHISSSTEFVDSINQTCTTTIWNFINRIEQGDFVGLTVSRIVPLLNSHLREYDTAYKLQASKNSAKDGSDAPASETSVLRDFRNGKFHPAVVPTTASDKLLQQNHVRKIVVRALPELMEDEMLKSQPVYILVREIMTCSVILPLVQILADPDTWNQIISVYGAATLQDRKTVRKLRAALDQHTPSIPAPTTTLELPLLQLHDSERVFEKHVRAIRKTRTLEDARRFRTQVANQLAQERANPDPDSTYVRRLEMSKRVLDQKIAKLTMSKPPGESTASPIDSVSGTPALSDIMHTATGLSYFMEFAHKQNKIRLVQFWTAVDGFRNPLEDDFGDDREGFLTWTSADRLMVARIDEMYTSHTDVGFTEQAQSAVHDFLTAGRNATPRLYRAARTGILTTQSAVLEYLEQNLYPDFRRTELYQKFISSEEGQKMIASKTPGQSTSVQAWRAVRTRPVDRVAALHRTSSQPASSKTTDLRKAVLSTTDLQRMWKDSDRKSGQSERRSLDLDHERPPLFPDDDEQDGLFASVASLDDTERQNEAEAVKDMEAAMSDIMTDDAVRPTSEDDFDVLESPWSDFKDHLPPISGQVSPKGLRDDLFGPPAKPNIASLGLVSTAGRIGVFQDNDLFGDDQHLSEDEYVDRSEHREEADDVDVVEAAPGDLGLKEAITILSNEIERLVSQESVVDALTRKAELTNNTAELRILGKSKSSLQREIRRKEMQRQQYIVQESDNSLFGRASVRIKSIMVGREDDGSEYALYLVEVQRRAGGSMPSATWAVSHRYSEFHHLHQKLRRRYPSTRGLEFPRRRMVMKLQKQFLHNRRLALESYLQQLLQMPDVCASRELRSFLSQQAISSVSRPRTSETEAANSQDIVTRIYNSVTDGMDEFLGNIAVLDQLSAAGQNLISAAQSQLNNKPADTVVLSSTPEPQLNSIVEAEAELRAFEDQQLEPFVKPICDFFLEAFELNRGSSWLRGRAVVVVLHQLLGGTIERKVREVFRLLFVDSALLRYIALAEDTFFPVTKIVDPGTGVEKAERRLRPSPPERTKAEKDRSRQEAEIVLTTLVPELAGSIVGRANAKIASRKILAVINQRKLNEHLVFTILDVVVSMLFDAKGKKDK